MKKLEQQIKASDSRILGAINALAGCERGIRAMKDFRHLMLNGGTGLDTVNMEALQTLMNEVVAGRRDFIGTLPV